MMKIKIHWKLTFIFCFVVILAIAGSYYVGLNRGKNQKSEEQKNVVPLNQALRFNQRSIVCFDFYGAARRSGKECP